MSSERRRAPINVEMTAEEEARCHREDDAWTGAKLVWLTIGSLAVALVILYAMAMTSAVITYDNFLWP